MSKEAVQKFIGRTAIDKSFRARLFDALVEESELSQNPLSEEGEKLDLSENDLRAIQDGVWTGKDFPGLSRHLDTYLKNEYR